MKEMTSNKPYLVRALFEWILDNDCTPHLLVAADLPGVMVPDGLAEDGQIVLNISPSAVRHFNMSNDEVSFEARFAGVPHRIGVPMYAVVAIYARENGEGMGFEVEVPEQQPEPVPPPRPEGRPSLKVIK